MKKASLEKILPPVSGSYAKPGKKNGLIRQRGYSTLIPSYPMNEKDEIAKKYGLTSIVEAADVLEMSRQAFLILVIKNTDLFDKIKIFDNDNVDADNGPWHIPTFYLDELKEKEEFAQIKAKYEFLAETSFLENIK